MLKTDGKNTGKGQASTVYLEQWPQKRIISVREFTQKTAWFQSRGAKGNKNGLTLHRETFFLTKKVHIVYVNENLKISNEKPNEQTKLV